MTLSVVFGLSAVLFGVNQDVLGRFYPKPDSIATNIQDGNFDVVIDDDLLVPFSPDDKHANSLRSIEIHVRRKIRKAGLGRNARVSPHS